MRTYARTLTQGKGLVCVNCGQKAIEMHNISACRAALIDRCDELRHQEVGHERTLGCRLYGC